MPEDEDEAEDKISASRTVWPRGLNITGRQRCVLLCSKALEDVMQSVATIESQLHVDRVDICTTTELELD